MKTLSMVSAVVVGALALVPASLAAGESKHSLPFTRGIQIHRRFGSGELKNQLPYTRPLP
jgi:hypothetical protein